MVVMLLGTGRRDPANDGPNPADADQHLARGLDGGIQGRGIGLRPY